MTGFAGCVLAIAEQDFGVADHGEEWSCCVWLWCDRPLDVRPLSQEYGPSGAL